MLSLITQNRHQDSTSFLPFMAKGAVGRGNFSFFFFFFFCGGKLITNYVLSVSVFVIIALVNTVY